MGKQSTISRRALLGGAVTAGLAAGTTGLAGCNLAGGGGGGGDGVVLNVWGGVPNETGPDDLSQAFMDEHPDIKVTYTRYVNDEPGNLKLDTSLTGGVPIDLYFSYSPVALFKRSSAGLAVELTEKIKAETDLAPFSIDADPIGNYALDGKQYCVPAARAPQHVYINKTMMDDAGVTLGESWTVDEFVEVAGKLTKSGVFGTLTGPPLARPALGPNYLYTAEGKSNFGNPWFARELELALQLQKDKIAMDRQTIIAEKLQTFSQNPFIAGRVAMLIQSGQIIRSINDTKEYPHEFQTYCMPIPLPEKGKPGWNTGQIGDLISISPKSKFTDQAWELAKFWMRNAGKYMTRGGRLPALVGSATPDDIVSELLSAEKDKLYDVESWKTMLFSDALKLPVDTVFTAGTEIQTINAKLTDETLLGDRTVASWVKEAVAQSDAAIGKAK